MIKRSNCGMSQKKKISLPFRMIVGSVLCRFRPMGRYSLPGRGRNVMLWDVATRENIATLEGHYIWGSVLCHFRPMVQYLPLDLMIDTIKLWDVVTGRKYRHISKGIGNSV